ncbi:hypothetical protein [Actinomadura luteofluorescens]
MFIGLTSMFFLDDPEHQRQRRMISSVFTARRVERMGGDITRVVRNALDALPGHRGPGGAVDLRAHYAYAIPMGVICHLLGIPEPMRPRFRALVDMLLDTDGKTAEDAAALERGRLELLDELVDLRRTRPGTDLTSSLITVRDGDGGTLSHRELLDTLWSLVVAGHETTLNLITNAVRALLTHPDQLARARALRPPLERRRGGDPAVGRRDQLPGGLATPPTRSPSAAPASRPGSSWSACTPASAATPASTAPPPAGSTSPAPTSGKSPSAPEAITAWARPSPVSKPASHCANCSAATPSCGSPSRTANSGTPAPCSPTAPAHCPSTSKPTRTITAERAPVTHEASQRPRAKRGRACSYKRKAG